MTSVTALPLTEGYSLSFNQWTILFNVLNRIAAHPIDYYIYYGKIEKF
jgi:hypothetical protein